MHSATSLMAVLALACLAWVTSVSVTRAAPLSFTVQLAGSQEVPPVTSPGEGTADLSYDPSTRLLTWSVTYSGLSSAATMAHFHGPAPAGKNAGVQIGISKQGTPPASPIKGQAKLTPSQAKQLMAGEWYINVHTADHRAGEIRGQLVPPKP
jgi:CHRD domain